MNLFFHKNYYYHLNNLFFFSNLKKNKSNKKWLLNIYLNYLFSMLFFYKKYILLFKKLKIFKKFINFKKLSFFKKVKKKNLIFKLYKILRIKYFLKWISFLKYIKLKISLNKFKISFLFDLLKIYIKNKIISKENFKLLNFLKLKLWHTWHKPMLIKFFLSKRIKKLYKIKYKKKRKLKYKFKKNKFSNLITTLDLFSNVTYNLKFNDLLILYKNYSNFYNIKTFKDLFLLLDRKLEYLLFNWFGLLKTNLNFLLKNNFFILNGYCIKHTNFLISNGFILNIQNKNELFLKKIFYVFYIKPNYFNKSYINNYLFKFLKKKLIVNLSFFKKNTKIQNIIKNNIYYFQYFLNFYSNKFINYLNIIFFKKNLKISKYKWVKYNIYMSINRFDNISISSFNNNLYKLFTFFKKKLNSLNYIGFYIYINLLKKNNKLKNYFIKIILFKKMLKYIFFNKINTKDYCFINFKSTYNYHIIKILSFLLNTNFSKINNAQYSKLNFTFLNKKKIKYKLQFKLSKSSLLKNIKNIYFIYKKIFFFEKYFLLKNIKHMLINIISSIILFNYINFNSILNYKNLILIYNLKNNNSFFNLNTKWLQIFNIEKKIAYPIKKFI